MYLPYKTKSIYRNYFWARYSLPRPNMVFFLEEWSNVSRRTLVFWVASCCFPIFFWVDLSFALSRGSISGSVSVKNDPKISSFFGSVYNSLTSSLYPGADPHHVQHSIRLGKNFLKINSKINLSLYDNLWRPRLIKSKRPSSPPVTSAQIWNTLLCAPHDSKMSNLPPFGVTLLMYLLWSAAFAAFAWNIYFDQLLLAILLVQRMKSHRFDWFAVPAHFGRGCLKQIRFFFFISVLIGVPQKHARYLFLIYSHAANQHFFLSFVMAVSTAPSRGKKSQMRLKVLIYFR